MKTKSSQTILIVTGLVFAVVILIFNVFQSGTNKTVYKSRESRYYTQTTAKININTATANELLKIDGVGETLAKRIVEYREKNGGFKDVDELKRVDGIGEKTLETIKNYVCVQ